MPEEGQGYEKASRRPNQELNLVEEMKINQTNVVYIVDRVLAELQRQKQSTKNKPSSKEGELQSELLASRNKNERKTHGHSETEQQEAFGTEFYREGCNTVSRIQHRQEVLEAFELLIKKKERRITAKRNSIGIGFGLSFHSDGVYDKAECSSERELMDAVFYDLRVEISRLGQDLKTPRCPNEEDVQAEALSCLPLESIVSHRLDKLTEGKKTRETSLKTVVLGEFGEMSLHGDDCGDKQRNLNPIVSAHPSIPTPEKTSVHRSASCFQELISTPPMLLDCCIPNRKEGKKERLAKIAMLNEVIRNAV